MKKILFPIFAACLFMPAMAQEIAVDTTTVTVISSQEQMLVYENPKIPVYIGDVEYEPLSTGKKVSTVLTGLLNNEISYEDELMVEGAKEALKNCLRDVNRFVIKTGEVSPEDKDKALIFSAKIVFCNVTEKLNNKIPDKEVRIVAYVTLTSAADNTVYFNKQVTGYTWLSVFDSMAKAREYTQNNLWVDAAASMRRGYPLRGHMLEKGFEKGKKQKLQQFYIDLGSNNRLFTNSTVDVFIVRRIAGRIARQYVGSAKVIDVQGEDIALCQVKKHGDQIKQAFDRGAEIAVQVY